MVGRRGFMRIGAVGIVMAAVVVGLLPQHLCAQVDGVLGLGRTSAVGGVSIDAQGIISAPQVTALRTLRSGSAAGLAAGTRGPHSGDATAQSLTPPARSGPTRGTDSRRAGAARRSEVPGGLQRMEYVFVFPEQHDIVVAGPAEGWQIDALGNVVGQTTGHPVVLLDDLLVAMRTARTSAQTGISCSIDPTPEGIVRLRKLVSRLRTIGNPQQTLGMIEQALGPQVVSVTGVPTSTHFARVMVAADFRMKRLAMHFDEPPIPDLPSYLQLLKPSQRGMQNLLPRWWLAPLYEPLLTDADGLSWQLRGQGVQCHDRNRLRRPTWNCESDRQSGCGGHEMGKQYDGPFRRTRHPGLGLRQPPQRHRFGGRRSPDRERRHAQSCRPRTAVSSWRSACDDYAAPKQVATQASFVKKGRNYLISASGGVQIYPWEIADKKQIGADLTATRKLALPAADQWWWN